MDVGSRSWADIVAYRRLVSRRSKGGGVNRVVAIVRRRSSVAPCIARGYRMSLPEDGFKMSRREVLLAGTTSVVAGAVPATSAFAQATAPTPGKAPVLADVSFTVNGKVHALKLDTRTTLLDALRE